MFGIYNICYLKVGLYKSSLYQMGPAFLSAVTLNQQVKKVFPVKYRSTYKQRYLSLLLIPSPVLPMPHMARTYHPMCRKAVPSCFLIGFYFLMVYVYMHYLPYCFWQLWVLLQIFYLKQFLKQNRKDNSHLLEALWKKLPLIPLSTR